MKRGEIWIADLNPIQGSEQSGIRPVIIFQTDIINKVTTTFLSIPLTTNLRRAELPSCVLIKKGEGGLEHDSVALCHQLRAIDKIRLKQRVGVLDRKMLLKIEGAVLLTMGII